MGDSDAKQIFLGTQVHVLAFSAHADAKGILQMLQRVAPKAVMLVHGEKQGMRFLKEKIIRDFGINCWDPPDGYVTTVETGAKVSWFTL